MFNINNNINNNNNNNNKSFYIYNNNINKKNKYITEEIINNILKKLDTNVKIKNIKLYQTALTHKSYIINNNNNNNNDDDGIYTTNDIVIHQKKSNELYELLGDSIINFIISEYLINRYPNENEGFITKLKTKLVDRNTFAKFSRYIN